MRGGGATLNRVLTLDEAGSIGIAARDVRQDEPLVAAAQRDAAAFLLLYERHAPDLYRYLRARTTSDHDAADLTSTTFEHAFRALGRYRSEDAPGGFRAWLFRIGRNAAIDAGRRRRRAVPLDGHEDVPAPVWADPEWSALEAERKAELRAQIGSLPESQRDAIVLRYAGGLTAREIAAVLGKSEAATQKLLTRALAQLKEAYRAAPR